MQNKNYTSFSPDIDFSGLDHIIIGSGMGGLTAATWLAKAGHKVAVFEQHYVPGGFTHSFKRKKGFQWDVGVHYVGNMEKDGGLRTLFNFLSNHKLDWEPMGDTYDVAYIGNDIYEFKAGKEAFRKQMAAYFPNEVTAINQYMRLLDKSNKRSNLFFMAKVFPPLVNKTLGAIFRKLFHKYAQKTTLEVLKSITTNQRLIAVLCAQCGDYGLTPKYSSFAAHALVVGHFMEGGYYPKGGADQIAKHTIDTLKAHGGEVYINAPVSKIITTKNRVQGIEIDGFFIPCKSVISNVGVNNTFNALLGEKERKKCGFNIESTGASSGHMCLYVGLDSSDKALNLPKHNVWWFEDENLDEKFDRMTVENAPEQFAYISFPSAKDPVWQNNHPEKATIQAVSVGRYEWFEKYENQPWMNREEEYQQIKKRFEEKMLKRLYQLFPQIKGHVIVTEVSSPLSTKHFSNYTNGEIYGLAHTPSRFKLKFLRPETKIKGLRLVGQDITLVGVAGAMLSGMLAAITILKFKVWKLFKNMRKIEPKVEH